jgi:hypothetical protein
MQSSEMIVTVPGGNEVLSNGRLEKRKDNPDGTATFHWLQDKPHASYLITLVIGKFAVVMLPFLMNTADYGPTLSADTARMLPEFLKGGRSSFFTDNLWTYWMRGSRSGLLPTEWFNWPSLYFLLMAALGCSLAFLIRYPERFPLVKVLTERISILPQMAMASFGLFLAAHAVLFKLHLPSRYTHHSARILMALSAGMVLIILLETLLRWIQDSDALWKRRFLKGFLALCALLVLCYPWLDSEFPVTHFVQGANPRLYAFFQRQPPDTLIASVASEANNLPAFSHRSILVGSEYAIPYHCGYYKGFRETAFALMTAHSTPQPDKLHDFIRRTGIDYVLIEENAFTPGYVRHHPWISQYKTLAIPIQHQLKHGQAPALAGYIAPCRVFQDSPYSVVSARCILKR